MKFLFPLTVTLLLSLTACAPVLCTEGVVLGHPELCMQAQQGPAPVITSVEAPVMTGNTPPVVAAEPSSLSITISPPWGDGLGWQPTIHDVAVPDKACFLPAFIASFKAAYAWEWFLQISARPAFLHLSALQIGKQQLVEQRFSADIASNECLGASRVRGRWAGEARARRDFAAYLASHR